MQAREDGPRLPIPIPPKVRRSLGATVPARRPRTELGTIIGATAAERKLLRFIRQQYISYLDPQLAIPTGRRDLRAKAEKPAQEEPAGFSNVVEQRTGSDQLSGQFTDPAA